MQRASDLLEAGLAHHKAGRLEAAEAAYAAVLEREPENAEAHHLMGVLAFQSGAPDAAAGLFARAVAARPDVAKYHGNLGAALLASGRVADAIPVLERAHGLDPGAPDARANLVLAYRHAGRAADAIALCRAALASDPGDAALRASLAAALLLAGEDGNALAEAQRAADEAPDTAEIVNTLGSVLQEHGRDADAAKIFARVVVLEPGFAEGWSNLGYALREGGRYGEAADAYRRAIALRPDNPAAELGLARALRLQGRSGEARPHYRKAVALAPGDARAHSAMLFNLLDDPDVDAAGLRAAHREWAARHAPPPTARPAPHANDPDPDRVLRIGYVSADFRAHPVGRLIAPVLAAHDPARVSAFCYSQAGRGDAITQRIAASCAGWREIAGLDDEALCARARDDAIDVLVDLSGHTGGNRLTAFALRPAPVQASWLGYQTTTGLPAMDWLIADSVLVPEGHETEIVEKPARLPRGFLAFVPPAEAPEVGGLPAERSGTVTFASFNNPGKIGAPCAAAWSRVLAAVPGSRLLLRYRGMEDAATRASLSAALEAAGIDRDRVAFEGGGDYRAVLEGYRRVDIALDTFPYSGAMTTLEALWMGVPVVTLRGRTTIGRQGASQLAAAGLGDLIADDLDGYVALAVSLAADGPRLAGLRAGLRDRLAASPLCDVAGFTAGLEDAFRMMWRRWCEARHGV